MNGDPTKAGALLRLDALDRSFGSTKALDGVSISLRAGRIVGLVGRNGAGKTTLIRCAAGLLAPSAGVVRFGPWDLGREPARAHGRVGYLGSSDRSFPPRLTARESLGMYGVLQGLPRRAALAKATALAERLGVAALLARPYQLLSSGERQRMGLVRALMHDPAMVLLDEPTYAIDRDGARSVFALLRECADAGMLVLISSHDLESIEAHCDDLLILQRGRAVAFGPRAVVLPRLEGTVWRLHFAGEASRDHALGEESRLRAGVDPEVALLREGVALTDLDVARWPDLRQIERREHASLPELLTSFALLEYPPVFAEPGVEPVAEPAAGPAAGPAAESVAGAPGPATELASRAPGPRAGAWSAFLAIVRRDMLIEFSYRFKVVVQFGVLLLWAVMMYFMARVYRLDEGMDAALYHNPMGFLLIGLGALEVSNICIARMGRSLREEQLMGTLEALVATARNPLLWVTGSLVWQLWTAVALAGGLFWTVHRGMGWSVDPSWLAASVAALLGCLALAALGLISAAFVHRYKRGDPLALVVNMLGLLSAGAYFPREVLPVWLQEATRFVPYTSTIQAVRASLLEGAGLGDLRVQSDLIALLGFDAVTIPIAVLTWAWAHRRARELGSLASS